MKKIVFFALITMMAMSCTIQKGYMTSNASLQTGNFKVIGIAKGHSSTFYFFMMFGGMSDEGLVFKAKQDMYDKAKLKDNQAIANITVDNSWSYIFPLMMHHDVFISGDIVQFKESGVGGAVNLLQK
jgi:hypothetical protein